MQSRRIETSPQLLYESLAWPLLGFTWRVDEDVQERKNIEVAIDKGCTHRRKLVPNMPIQNESQSSNASPKLKDSSFYCNLSSCRDATPLFQLFSENRAGENCLGNCQKGRAAQSKWKILETHWKRSTLS